MSFVGSPADSRPESGRRGQLVVEHKLRERVLVEGELQSRTFKTEKGDSKTIVEIKARRIQFLNKKLVTADGRVIEEHEDIPIFEDDSFEKHLSPEDTALLEGGPK